MDKFNLKIKKFKLAISNFRKKLILTMQLHGKLFASHSQMNSVHFDELGYLKPYEGIPADLESVNVLFVKAFPNSLTRQWLYDNYLQYIEDFRRKVFPHFQQWLNGSFVTPKLNPRDIDVVTFLDHEIFYAKEKLLDDFLSFSLETKGLDAYIVPLFPTFHEHFPIAENFKSQWFKRFTSTKADELDRIYEKGFLKLDF